MLIKDEGFVVRGGRSGETSRHITFFGREYGKIKLMGKGAMSSRSPLRATLETGNLIEAVFYHKANRTLYFIKEATLIHAARRDSLAQLSGMLATSQLVDQVCYWGSPEGRVVDLFVDLQSVDDTHDAMFAFLVFQFKLLNILGMQPDLFSCHECGDPIDRGYYNPLEGASHCRRHAGDSPHRVNLEAEDIELLRNLSDGDVRELVTMSIDRSRRKRLGKLLHWTYTSHIQGYSLPEALKLIPKN